MKPEDEEGAETAPRIVMQMSERQRERMEVIQALLAASDKETYRERERWAAQQLLSLNTLYILVRPTRYATRLVGLLKSVVQSGIEGLFGRIIRIVGYIYWSR
jgi:hypothetical protein